MVKWQFPEITPTFLSVEFSKKKKKTNQKINKYQTPIFKKPQKIKKKIIKKTKSDIRVYQGRFPEIQNLSSVVLSLKN